jgi:hypothetical protein
VYKFTSLAGTGLFRDHLEYDILELLLQTVLTAVKCRVFAETYPSLQTMWRSIFLGQHSNAALSLNCECAYNRFLYLFIAAIVIVCYRYEFMFRNAISINGKIMIDFHSISINYYLCLSSLSAFPEYISLITFSSKRPLKPSSIAFANFTAAWSGV